MIRFLIKIILNSAALYAARNYLSGFGLEGGLETILTGGVVLALLNTFIRPIFKLVSAPLLWISFGLFNILINMAILWIADKLLAKVAITGWTALFWASIMTTAANIF